jgi:hypothetical protein
MHPQNLIGLQPGVHSRLHIMVMVAVPITAHSLTKARRRRMLYFYSLTGARDGGRFREPSYAHSSMDHM